VRAQFEEALIDSAVDEAMQQVKTVAKRWRGQLEKRKAKLRDDVTECRAANASFKAMLDDEGEAFETPEACSAAVVECWHELRASGVDPNAQSREHETVHIEIVQPAC
jgi:hypothetical protein